MAGDEKSIGKALLLDGFLRKLGSRNLQTQAVLFGKEIGSPFPSFELRALHRQTELLTG